MPAKLANIRFVAGQLTANINKIFNGVSVVLVNFLGKLKCIIWKFYASPPPSGRIKYNTHFPMNNNICRQKDLKDAPIANYFFQIVASPLSPGCDVPREHERQKRIEIRFRDVYTR